MTITLVLPNYFELQRGILWERKDSRKHKIERAKPNVKQYLNLRRRKEWKIRYTQETLKFRWKQSSFYITVIKMQSKDKSYHGSRKFHFKTEISTSKQDRIQWLDTLILPEILVGVCTAPWHSTVKCTFFSVGSTTTSPPPWLIHSTISILWPDKESKSFNHTKWEELFSEGNSSKELKKWIGKTIIKEKRVGRAPSTILFNGRFYIFITNGVLPLQFALAIRTLHNICPFKRHIFFLNGQL